MNLKLIGGILLVTGTSIGAGMLALPIVTANLGFPYSFLLLVFCWFIMMSSALTLLEVNLWMPSNSNLISMAKHTIGPIGQLVAWISTLLLLYSLLSAYIDGGSDLLYSLFLKHYTTLPKSFSAILFTLLFGTIVTLGIRFVDYSNRLLMIIKFTSLFLVIGLLSYFISLEKLLEGDWHALSSSTAMTVTITSFGFAVIVPSLRVYFKGDALQLRKVIIIGSSIPLICYLLWDGVIMGVVPLHGPYGLSSILQTTGPTAKLVSVLEHATATTVIHVFVKLFTSVCVLTSFLGVALSLSDFLADGLSLEKKGLRLLGVQLITFLPPLFIVLLYPDIFIKALKYAGINCLVLLVLLPAWMAFKGRYVRGLKHEFTRVSSKLTLIFLIIFSILAILWSIVSN